VKYIKYNKTKKVFLFIYVNKVMSLEAAMQIGDIVGKEM